MKRIQTRHYIRKPPRIGAAFRLSGRVPRTPAVFENLALEVAFLTYVRFIDSPGEGEVGQERYQEANPGSDSGQNGDQLLFGNKHTSTRERDIHAERVSRAIYNKGGMALLVVRVTELEFFVNPV